MTGSVNALANAGADRLRLDLLEVFAAAGLAPPVDEPARSARQPRPEDDEAPFEFRYDD